MYRRADEQGEIDLDAEDRAELNAAIQTIEIQQRSPRPKRRFIGLALTEINMILSGAAGGGLYEAAKRLFELLHGG